MTVAAITKQRTTCLTEGCTGRALQNSDHCRACWQAWWRSLGAKPFRAQLVLMLFDLWGYGRAFELRLARSAW